MLKKLSTTMLACLFMLPLCPMWAASSVNSTVTLQVNSITAISVSGNPGSLVIGTATAGSAPDAAVDATTTYSITHNNTSAHITAALNVAMPGTTTLGVNLQAPTGGTSAGNVNLTATAQNVVTSIGPTNQSGKTITYTFTATAADGILTSFNKTVTFTILTGAT
jgi:hypothetical protein